MTILAKPAVLDRLATAAMTGVTIAAAKPNTVLSATAVADAQHVIREEVEKAIASTPTAEPLAVVEVKSSWLSKINIGAVISFAATMATLFGYDFDPETQKTVIGVIAGLTTLYMWAMRTFFTTTVTASSMPAAVGKL